MAELEWEKIETIIDEVLALPESKHQEFIEYKCGNDAALKSEVTLLLRSIFDSDGWLENPLEYKNEFYEGIADDLEKLGTSSSLIGQAIGSYTITEELGTGGMGSVYLAQRSDDAFEHRVAIKMIRQGKASQENIERFKRERRILAELNHPGIAKLFDGGITEDGIPYLIMEYIDGIPVTQYCKQSALSLEVRITLFEKILEAVRHAHENAIIHRDLKPGNILVTPNGEVKILDFGISKMLDDDSGSDLTQTKARLLTPRYAAPEQIMQQSPTTATDLYALGIIFYQLVSGEHPFNLEELSQYDMEQAILAQRPSVPSAKVAALFPVSQAQLKGDLDAIALKAIRKEPTRRYRTTNEFLDDLQNYSQGLPVEAHADSFRYRAGKFFNRHRAGIITATGMILLLATLITFYTYRITQKRNQAQLEAQKAEQISNFLMSLFKARNPNFAKGRTITAGMLLEWGIDRAEALNTQPIVQARLFGLFGELTLGLGNYSQSDSLTRQALALLKKQANPDKAEILKLKNDLANVFLRQGKLDKADSLLSTVLTLSRKNGFNQQTAIALNDLGNLAQQQSDYLRAEKLHRQALELRISLYGREHKGVAASFNNIALALQSQGKFEEAEPFYRRGLELDKKIFGKLHTETTLTMRNLGQLFRKMEKYEEAELLLREVVRIDQLLLGNKHPRIAKDLNELAVLHSKLGNYKAADSINSDILEILQSTLEPNHPRIALTLNNMAWLAIRRNKIERAEKLYRKALPIAIQRFGNDHVNTALYKHNLASTLHEQRQYSEAEVLYREALSTLRANLAPDHYLIGHPLIELGKLLTETSRPDEAKLLLEDAVKNWAAHFGADHVKTAEAKLALGNCLKEKEAFPRAERYLKEAYKVLKSHDHEDKEKAERLLSELYKRWGKSE